uniref:Hyaluronan/mRNA-binding protein domain-containing protein n=1 Tax=Thalassionema nitzschioides TaxID=33649 RepID=A0A7S1E099_9STRA|mmetsp:Transcript_186/g.176  ORF Transcript_186/g.176 Transcript_186/m.176 type:complete len:264 (+) Transcript_186:54-845(+)
MSNNFFAALDDDDDVAVKVAPPKKEQKSQGGKHEKAAKDNRRQIDDIKKHGKGGRGSGRGGKREFERKSGTGRGKEIKKGGGGARNWGSDKNEARTAQGSAAEDLNEESPGIPEETVEEPIVEEVDNTISYEEYLKKKTIPNNEAFENREERAVENEFASAKPKEIAKEEEFLVMGGSKQQRKREKNKEKKTVDVGFRSAPTNQNDDRRDGRGSQNRGRGEKGGRRDGRGRGRGRGRGNNERRGNSNRGTDLNTMDASAFPCL